MMLTTKGRYAVMAMVDIAMHGNNTPVSVADIAARQDITVPYLEQIFAQLRRSGLVKSVRGPGGGYLLVRPVDETRVSDIVLAVDEPIKMTRCREGGGAGCLSDKSRCLTHDLWEGLGQQIYQYLRAVTLADICARRVPVALQQDSAFRIRAEGC
ncbi:MAG: Rrf2 family transcriptional regulator [Hyphomicrobiales bacterium]|nr:Rrf2 family transcriptional regulator [Rickettsiales bacterium]MCP5362142.1 Rrf2 family transcriptional regulator [Hyphomicrobiales bacterium]